MSALFLKREELQDLTGYVYAAKQIKWLTNNGYMFEVSSDGFPRLLRSHLIAKLSEKPRQLTPNFGALKRG